MPSADWRWRSCAGCRGSRAPPPSAPPARGWRRRSCRSAWASSRDSRHARTRNRHRYPVHPAGPRGSVHRPEAAPMTLKATRLLAAAILLATTATSQAAPPPDTLKQAYADAFLLGTAVNDDMVSGRDARAQALAVRHFNAITAENVMKAEVLHPQPGQWDFDAADAFVAFGRQHDM